MMAFSALSVLVRAAFSLWALLLCLVNIGSGALAAAQKRVRFTGLAVLLLVPAYFIWQVIFDYSLFGETPKAAVITRALCALPWIYPLLALVLLSTVALWLFIYNIRYANTYITPSTIKFYLDKIPCGICCWQENGRVLFSNLCMNELCLVLTGAPLLNGNQFRDALGGEMVKAGTKMWHFTCREMTVGGEQLYELVAYDVTGEYTKTRTLEKEKEDLARLNRELREYYLSLDETVKQQEILQAKMNIHDEMNGLMLSTVAVNQEDTQALDNIFSLWEQRALLLSTQADKKQQETQAVRLLADALGITLAWQGTLPPSCSDKQRQLIIFTAKEAIANAAKHAGATHMEIEFEQTPIAVICRFTSDGVMPRGEVHFAGGLANLALLAEKQGATLAAIVGEAFTLELRFPKSSAKNEGYAAMFTEHED